MDKPRVILIVMDGCGVGAMPDAADFGPQDAASATLPHVVAAVGGLSLPTLARLGLGHNIPIEGVPSDPAEGAWGRMAEASQGKDSVTGHWEMAGVITQVPFPTYPHGFPSDVVAAFERAVGRPVLGNVASSGTDILNNLGTEHMATGKPIVYTSADSVFQIAAHEDVVPIAQLYAWCEAARTLLVAPHNIQRVIARPFLGDAQTGFVRTPNRRDFPLPPPPGHLLDVLQNAGKICQAIGVVADLFPADCFSLRERTQTNADALDAIVWAVQEGSADFVFANCEDFDMLYGHRNDPAGFARCLEDFDNRLEAIVRALRPDDLLLLTADHGNDPTTSGTDHSREYVPLLAQGASVPSGDLGTRTAFADLAATICAFLGTKWTGPGTAFVSMPA